MTPYYPRVRHFSVHKRCSQRVRFRVFNNSQGSKPEPSLTLVRRSGTPQSETADFSTVYPHLAHVDMQAFLKGEFPQAQAERNGTLSPNQTCRTSRVRLRFSKDARFACSNELSCAIRPLQNGGTYRRKWKPRKIPFSPDVPVQMLDAGVR